MNPHTDLTLAPRDNSPTTQHDRSLKHLTDVVVAARVAHATLCDLQRDDKTQLSWYTQLDVQAATDQLHAALLKLEGPHDAQAHAPKHR